MYQLPYKIPFTEIENNIDNDQYINKYEKMHIAINCIFFNKFELYEKIVEKIDNFDIRFENDTLLVAACISANVINVQYFIDKKLDVTINDNYIIRECIRSPKYSEVLQLIINHGANVNAGNGIVLVNAIECPSVKLFEILIKHGADYRLNNYKAVIVSSEIDSCTYFDSFASYDENEHSDDEVLTNNFLLYFINEGIDVNLGDGILFKNAMVDFSYDNVELLIKNGFDIKYIELGDLVPVIKCMMLEFIVMFINYGVDFSILNSYQSVHSEKLFIDSMSYIIYDSMYSFDWCLTSNNIINDKIYKLMHSCLGSTNSVLKTLISKNDLAKFEKILNESNIDIRFDNDVSLAVAIMSNNLDTVRYLLDRGLDIHSDDDFAIKICCAKNINGDILRLFIDEYKIDAGNDEFINIAIDNNNMMCVKILIENGANIFFDNGVKFIKFNNYVVDPYFDNLLRDAPDYNMLLEGAVSQGLYKSTKLLLQYGADINLIEPKHLFCVFYSKNIAFIEMLTDNHFYLTILNTYTPSEDSIKFVSTLVNVGINAHKLPQILLS